MFSVFYEIDLAFFSHQKNISIFSDLDFISGWEEGDVYSLYIYTENIPPTDSIMTNRQIIYL